MIKSVFFIIMILSNLASAGDESLVIERIVHLRNKAEVWSQTVCIDDLVDESWLKSKCLNEKENCCLWSLDGNRNRIFKRYEIQKKLLSNKIRGIKLEIIGPDETEVLQTKREITLKELNQKSLAAIAAKLNEDINNISIQELKTFSPMFIGFQEENDWDVIINDIQGEYLTAKVISTSNRQLYGWVKLKAKAEIQGYVANRKINNGETLNISDFSLKKINVLSSNLDVNNFFKKNQFPVGFQTKQTLQIGDAILAQWVDKIPSVRLGETITLILKSDSLKITTKGIVQGTAAVGDMVTVQLLKYNRSFRGKLLDGKTVEIWF